MILITGATGHLGKATIDFLLKSVPAGKIAAMVRDEAKAAGLKEKGITLRTGDYTDYASMVKAFAAIDTLLLISSSDMNGDRAAQHINAINAAKEAGVKHILYTGIAIKDLENTPLIGISEAHAKTYAHLKASGLNYTLLHNGLYADVLPMLLGDKVLETGIYFPAGDGRIPFATRTDMAEAIAAIVAGAGHEGKEYVLNSDVAYSFDDIAGILSQLAGKEISYTSPDKDTYINTLKAAGVPDMLAVFSASFGEANENDEYNVGNSSLENFLGRKPTALKEYLKEVYSV